MPSMSRRRKVSYDTSKVSLSLETDCRTETIPSLPQHPLLVELDEQIKSARRREAALREALGSTRAGLAPIYRETTLVAPCQQKVAVGMESEPSLPLEPLPLGSLSGSAMMMRQSLRLIRQREAELKARLGSVQAKCGTIPSPSVGTSCAMPQLIHHPDDTSRTAWRGRLGESKSAAVMSTSSAWLRPLQPHRLASSNSTPILSSQRYSRPLRLFGGSGKLCDPSRTGASAATCNQNLWLNTLRAPDVR
mmetsp:Transcript_36308/g.60136  ORF Transcript_36308/g.60136 Transcript_36308/m.60136 type:complete len:249 (+) Transcript_36308:27-773(+)